MEFGIQDWINYLARWGHIVFGIAWIGLLYYFNLVQGGYAAKATDEAKVDLFTKLVPSALWWFRWAAMFTFLTGLVLLYFIHAAQTIKVDIVLGVVMATLMFLNVWLIIWPNQKIVIASNEAVAAGGEADPGQAGAAGKALLASRTNTLFSLPMIFFMSSNNHFGLGGGFMEGGLDMIIGLIIIALLEINAIFGKLSVLTTVKGVITSSVVLTVAMVGIVLII